MIDKTNMKTSTIIAAHCAALCFFSSATIAADSWRGLTLEPENRCTPYDKESQYPYPQSVEDIIVAGMGGQVYGPYTGRYFESDRETDIEHIVAASEGHDSGLCRASADIRRAFATDPLNLTLAAPAINRCGAEGKCGLDAGEWMPPKNQCWFANRVIEIKTKYNLSVDLSEAKSIDSVLASCSSTEMIFFPRSESASEPYETLETSSDPLSLYDVNGNGRITCAEAKQHGIAPVYRGHPAYEYMYDKDGDGKVCDW